MADSQTEATRAHVLALYADYVRGNMPAVMAGLAEDIVWQSLARISRPGAAAVRATRPWPTTSPR